MPLMPGAEPFHHAGGEVGVLLVHGFTGTPQSMRPWADHFAERGLTVSLPLLPGHGTHWKDMQVTGWQDWYAEVDRALRELRRTCTRVFVCGMSMGGALSLYLAARHGEDVDGVCLVNPSVKADSHLLKALPVLRHLVPSVAGLIGDIAKEGEREVGYDRTPLHAAHSLAQFWRIVRDALPQVTQPVLLMHSAVDHVVDPSNSDLVMARVSSADLTEVVLERSHHVATLDHDAGLILDRSWEFVRRLAPGAGKDGVTSGGA
ncbi:alpha/beta fold hydrolase [Streptomyces thermolineatus]|uniref:Alpha/beta fold hydrolase n=1 Tax=Streptomyces thermolineatus TaxID=44033 RepID=A0ABN3LV30_9ACTN